MGRIARLQALAIYKKYTQYAPLVDQIQQRIDAIPS